MVDTDTTASKVLEVMLKEKTGRVTFVPLNRLKPKPVQYPQSSDAQPLIKKLRYDPVHAKAFEQVFGKTCVCEDLTLAASYVRRYNLNTITIDGDKVDRKGALTGGYYDIRRSRIDAVKAVKTWRPKFEEFTKNHGEVREAILRLDQEITQITGQLQVAQTKYDHVYHQRDPLVRESTYVQHEHERLVERAAKFEADLEDLKTEIIAQKARKEAYQKELGTPMAQGLTHEELATTEQLRNEVDHLKNSLLALSQRRNEVCTPTLYCTSSLCSLILHLVGRWSKE